MSAGEEVSEIDEFAVVLILNVDDSPSVLAAADLLASNDDRLLGPNNCEWDDALYIMLANIFVCSRYRTNLDLSIQGALLLVELIIVVWVHLQVVESKLLLYALLEGASLLKSQRIRLGNDWDNIDNI